MPTRFEYEYPSDDDEPVELPPWCDWPHCPRCRQARQARCPTCGFAASNMPLADYQELGAPAWRAADRVDGNADSAHQPAVLLMCPQCEEAFRPRFYNRCAGCGFDFGEGLRPEVSETDAMTFRALAVTASLLVLLGGIVFYFWAILRL